jgi:hypothetical protein
MFCCLWDFVEGDVGGDEVALVLHHNLWAVEADGFRSREGD